MSETSLRVRIREADVWSAEDAIGPVAKLFDDIVEVLKRNARFAGVSRDELDLLLADTRIRAEQQIGDLVDDTISVGAIDFLLGQEGKQ
jgi:hypothetical protein